ncbi:MAG: PEP-CTERM sorting domain-containing protein [Phycisphaerae bacterium]|nr:PEP-CTERM sorting domain-containing protein [Phycisphaerae bacterium]
MFTKRTITFAALLAVAFSTARIAQADIMHYNGMGLKKYVDVLAWKSLAGRNFGTSAGQVKLDYQGTDYLGYCVDVFAYSGSSAVTEASYTTLRNGEQVAYLFETNSSGITHREQAAGLQVAIWELLYENNNTLDFNLDTGNFKITNSSVIDDANDMLDDMRANMPGNYSPIMQLLVLQSPCKQDMLIGREPPVIPEPATVLLLAVGGLFVLKRNRRRRALENA